MGKSIRNMIPLIAVLSLLLSIIGNGLSVLAAETEAYEKTVGQTEMVKYESEGNQNNQTEPEQKAAGEEDGLNENQAGSAPSDTKPAAAGGITVELQDDIMQSGCLKAVVSGADASSAAYQWYESSDGNRWEAISDTDTVNSKEADYYVAMNGARKFYKVRVTDGQGNEAESTGFQVVYYDSLQNGGFEKPRTNAMELFPNGTAELEWRTSSKDANGSYLVEIISGNIDSSIYNISGPSEGNQFAELNATTAGALYQDILTQPGAILYWGLDHAGRKGVDTMSVLISNAKNIPSEWNPSLGNYGEFVGDLQMEISDDKGEWRHYTGTYEVPEGQYVTRFYFAAKSFAGGDITVGNLLDKVQFAKEVPEPSTSKGNLTIHKKVAGDGMESIPNGAFTFAVKDHAGNSVRNFSLPTATGEWQYTLTNLTPGEYTVSETAAGLPGWILKSVECSVNGGEKFQGDVASVNVQEKQTAVVSYTNTYEPAGRSMIFVNKTAGNMGDAEKEFKFIWQINSGEEQSVKLKSGAEFSIPNVKKGDKVLVREITEEKYQTVLTVVTGTADNNIGDGAVYTSEIQEDTRVLFTNTKNMSPPTGVSRNNVPYIIMIIAAFGIPGILNGRRKKRL